MEIKKVNCWLNWQEWKSVANDAYNEENDPVAFRRAFSTILAWEARDQNLPSALLCLRELLAAKLNQINNKKNTDSVDQIYAYQSGLAMNLVRFVNFITEPYQTNLFAKSVKSIANSIGLPDWIVNLRHNATHFNLPCIEVLESALDFLFQWLKERYIDKYREIPLEQSILQDIKSHVQKLLVDYMNTRYQTVMMRVKNKSIQIQSVKLDKKMEEASICFRNETFEILLENGFLIPTREQLNAIGIVAEEFLEQETLDIPKSFFTIWMEFLTHCNENNLISFLLESLMGAYKLDLENWHGFNVENLRIKFLLSWIVCLIKNNSYKNEKSKNSKFRFEFSFKQVLLDILSTRPNNYSYQFLKEVSKVGSFSAEINSAKLEKLKTILELVHLANSENQKEVFDNDKENTSKMEYENETFYNLALFEKNNEINNFPMRNFDIYSRNERKKSQFVKSDWKLIDDVNWNHDNLKLGLIDGQNYISLNFDIRQVLENQSQDQIVNEASIKPVANNNQQINIPKMTKSLIQLDPEKIEYLKKSLMNNYWEFNSN